MILELFIIATIIMLGLTQFGVMIPIWIAIIPYLLTYVIRIAVLMYERASKSRWEEHQRIRALELEGLREFKDVMIGTFVAYLRREETSSSMTTPTKTSELSKNSGYIPPGYEEESIE